MEAELQENSDRKNAIKMQQILKDCQSKLADLEKKSKETLAVYNQYKVVYNNMMQNLEVIEKNSDSDNTAKVDGLIDAIDAIVSNLTRLDKEMNSVLANCNVVQAEYANIMKNARSAKASMQKYKESFVVAKDQAEKNIEAKKTELAEQAKKVDKQLLAKYKQKSAEKHKVFVPAMDGKCGGCRMEISAGKLNVLKSAGYIECENCGRIIYLKDKNA